MERRTVAEVNLRVAPARAREWDDAKTLIARSRSNEVFFGVVGPVGAGSSRVMESLARAAAAAGYECVSIKASDQIRRWAEMNGKPAPPALPKRLDKVIEMQDLGDQMRARDPAAVARAVIGEIADQRAQATGVSYQRGEAVQPDHKKRAYLIDSIRHPAEIQLLRRTYANAFALIGVVCQPEEREQRVLGKYFTAAEKFQSVVMERVSRFISRDADDPECSHGQHVTDAFHAADFFVDNTAKDERGDERQLDEPLGRLLNIVGGDAVVSPTIEETAMHHAHSARVRSACMSRQVGAALVDHDGTVLATGTNEVPRAGGGVYGERAQFEAPELDDRCVFRETRFCSSNREQNTIVDELIREIPELRDSPDGARLRASIRETRLGQLIEFSRAVHAEMDALLSAGRNGASTVGTRLFVTTFPCHYCARHIVSAGVYEVQYVEPYPKSRALALHADAIATDERVWTAPEIVSMAEGQRRAKIRDVSGEGRVGKVLFRPFVGVAPRLYGRAFEKIRRLKDKVSGDYDPHAPEWGDEWMPFTLAYPELEAKLAGGS